MAKQPGIKVVDVLVMVQAHDLNRYSFLNLDGRDKTFSMFMDFFTTSHG